MLSITVAAITIALQSSPFPDVPATHWAASAVQNLKDAGILRGYPSGRFQTAIPKSDLATEARKFCRVLAANGMAEDFEARACREQPPEVWPYELTVSINVASLRWDTALKEGRDQDLLKKYLQYSPQLIEWADRLRPQLNSMDLSAAEFIERLKDLQKRTKEIKSK